MRFAGIALVLFVDSRARAEIETGANVGAVSGVDTHDRPGAGPGAGAYVAFRASLGRLRLSAGPALEWAMTWGGGHECDVQVQTLSAFGQVRSKVDAGPVRPFVLVGYGYGWSHYSCETETRGRWDGVWQAGGGVELGRLLDGLGAYVVYETAPRTDHSDRVLDEFGANQWKQLAFGLQYTFAFGKPIAYDVNVRRSR